jgi:histidyl-tRNA synthetase
MSNEVYLSDTAKLALIDALAGEVIQHGQAEAEIIASDSLTDKEADVLMKTNTFLTAFALLLLEVVERQDVALAKAVLDIWTSSKIQDLILHAFTDEIQAAQASVANEIDELEKIINTQGDTNA